MPLAAAEAAAVEYPVAAAAPVPAALAVAVLTKFGVVTAPADST